MKWGLCLAEIWRKLIQAEAGGLPGVRGTARGVKGGGRAGQGDLWGGCPSIHVRLAGGVERGRSSRDAPAIE